MYKIGEIAGGVASSEKKSSTKPISPNPTEVDEDDKDDVFRFTEPSSSNAPAPTPPFSPSDAANQPQKSSLKSSPVWSGTSVAASGPFKKPRGRKPGWAGDWDSQIGKWAKK